MVNFNPIDKGYIVRWQSDLVNTKENELNVCDKSYHTNNGFQQNGEEIKICGTMHCKIFPNKAVTGAYVGKSTEVVNDDEIPALSKGGNPVTQQGWLPAACVSCHTHVLAALWQT